MLCQCTAVLCYFFVSQLNFTLPAAYLNNDSSPLAENLKVRCDSTLWLNGWLWSRTGEKFDSSRVMSNITSKYTVRGNTLLINTVTRADEGLYSCEYDSGLIKQLCIFVYGKPVFYVIISFTLACM